MEYVLSLNSLDLSNSDTSELVELKGMFSSCSSLLLLNLKECHTSKVLMTK